MEKTPLPMALLFIKKTPREAPVLSSKHKKKVWTPYKLSMFLRKIEKPIKKTQNNSNYMHPAVSQKYITGEVKLVKITDTTLFFLISPFYGNVIKLLKICWKHKFEEIYPKFEPFG